MLQLQIYIFLFYTCSPNFSTVKNCCSHRCRFGMDHGNLCVHVFDFVLYSSIVTAHREIPNSIKRKVFSSRHVRLAMKSKSVKFGPNAFKHEEWPL